MRNFWLNKVERALRHLGYIPEILKWFTEAEKEALIIDEYLHMLRDDAEDCTPLGLDDMADYIIRNRPL